MIVGITGLKNAGKDTAAQYLVNKYGFTRIGYADTLKEAVSALFQMPVSWFELHKNDPRIRVQLVRDHWTPAREDRDVAVDMSLRVFLQAMGTEMGREVFGQDFWVEQLKRRIKPGKNYVISDVRFNNEVVLCDFIVEIHRPTVRVGDNHVSEQGLREELIDFIVPNDGTIEDLHRRVEECLTDVLSSAALSS